MQEYKQAFDQYVGVKKRPNTHELELFVRAQNYIKKIENIPGIQMVAICNSLSMYATHDDSDIDLFIVTKPDMLWYVRFFVTLKFWRLGVWRKGHDIAGNFCLSFFVTSDALDLSQIALQDDIYLYYWIYYLKPIIDGDNIYEQFLLANSWVTIDEPQWIENRQFELTTSAQRDSKNVSYLLSPISGLIRFFLRRKTMSKYEKLGQPEGVIISDNMLKFHDQDRREEIRDAIFERKFGQK